MYERVLCVLYNNRECVLSVLAQRLCLIFLFLIQISGLGIVHRQRSNIFSVIMVKPAFMSGSHINVFTHYHNVGKSQTFLTLLERLNNFQAFI